MATYSYTCSPAANRQVDAAVEREFADPPEMADEYFFARPAILELCNPLKRGDVVRMAYDERVLSRGLSVLQDWRERLGVEIEFHLDPDRKIFAGMMQSGLVLKHVLERVQRAGYLPAVLPAGLYESALAMCNEASTANV